MASKRMLFLVVVLTVATAVLGKPTETDLVADLNENIIPQGDDPDVAVKTVIPEDSETETTEAPSSSLPGVTVTVTVTSKPTNQTTPLSTFSRIVNDFFQIPIGVIRAVNTWMTNTFSAQKKN